jgi:hypothetical protein
VYHEPFKDTCIESDIVIDDCNKYAQTSESTIFYKYVNFCGALMSTHAYVLVDSVGPPSAEVCRTASSFP